MTIAAEGGRYARQVSIRREYVGLCPVGCVKKLHCPAISITDGEVSRWPPGQLSKCRSRRRALEVLDALFSIDIPHMDVIPLRASSLSD